MSRLARRYWASLTDTNVESAELLIEYGRQRNATLWRRYVASLLDMPVTCGVTTETKQTEGLTPAPTSTIFYDMETVVDIGTAPPNRGSWWRGAGLAFVTLLALAVGFGVSRLLPPVPGVATPATSVDAVYHKVNDPAGYVISIPRGWAREETQGKLQPVVTYTAPNGLDRLMVFEVKEISATESSAQAQSIAEGLKGYHYLGRRTGANWTEFSYRYDSKQYGATRTIDHRFQAADGTPYAIIVYSPPGTDMTEPLTKAVNSLCPTGAPCSEPG
ncbi:hypothetical protein ACH4S8_43470 [Streptomyces sp. NPDC021080]|uniref:hypothetical protein n=1 Tax=Streptomyces sp. NPDC021080 TaxID=3365110 RepID=UPI0037AD9302